MQIFSLVSMINIVGRGLHSHQPYCFKEQQHMRIYSQEKQFYVYSYLRDDGTPYYIGKGFGDRLFDKDHTVKPPKDKTKVKLLNSKMTEVDALQAEMLLICLYGRKNKNSGCLRNLTDGGDGCSGMIHSLEAKKKISNAHKGKLRGSPSLQTKEKLSKANKGKQLSEEHKRKISLAHSGKILTNTTKQKISAFQKEKIVGPFTEDHKRKISLAMTGKIRGPLSDDTKKKISNAHRGRIISQEQRIKISNTICSNPKVLCENCNKFFDKSNFYRWHGNKCKFGHHGLMLSIPELFEGKLIDRTPLGWSLGTSFPESSTSCSFVDNSENGLNFPVVF
jgi:hypothetical protein